MIGLLVEQQLEIGKWLRQPLPWMRGSLRSPFTQQGAVWEWRTKRFVRTNQYWLYYIRVLAIGLAGMWWVDGWGKGFGFLLIAWLMSESLVQTRLGETPTRQQVLPLTQADIRKGTIRAYQWIFTAGLTVLLIPTGFGLVPFYAWWLYPLVGYGLARGILTIRL